MTIGGYDNPGDAWGTYQNFDDTFYNMDYNLLYDLWFPCCVNFLGIECEDFTEWNNVPDHPNLNSDFDGITGVISGITSMLFVFLGVQILGFFD
jgi:hypothetical protein